MDTSQRMEFCYVPTTQMSVVGNQVTWDKSSVNFKNIFKVKKSLNL